MWQTPARFKLTQHVTVYCTRHATSPCGRLLQHAASAFGRGFCIRQAGPACSSVSPFTASGFWPMRSKILCCRDHWSRAQMWMFRIAINKLFEWLFSRVLAYLPPRFSSRPGHVSPGASSLG